MGNLAAGFYRISEWITRFLYLNFLWVLFTIAGLGIFGLMPATVAMFTVTRKWVRNDLDVPVFETFWEAYRREFVKSNVFGLLFGVVIYLLVIEFVILFSHENVIFNIASFGVIAIFILLAIILAYFFPVYVHFNISNKFDHIKWPFIIGIVHPILTIVMIVGISGVYYMVFVTLRLFLYVIGGSVASYLLMLGASQTFDKYELKGNLTDASLEEIEGESDEKGN